jgi:hypothetical protein
VAFLSRSYPVGRSRACRRRSDRPLPGRFRALADNKLAALLDERRTAPRDIYDLEVLLARGACPSSTVVERVGGQAALLRRAGEKLDLMGWPLFRDQVIPARPQEIQAHVDEHEYLAMKERLLESLERCLAGGNRTETRP